MAVKTFAVGELVTASDANTYLANAGLVYVKSQTIGTGVSSVTVSNAFSADYDAYKITITGGVGSTSVELSMRLGSATTNYRTSIIYTTYISATPQAIVNNANTNFQYIGRCTSSTLTFMCDIRQPFQSLPTFVTSNYVAEDASGVSNGIQYDNTSFTAFTIFPQLGTLTGGTITVYGYRKA